MTLQEIRKAAVHCDSVSRGKDGTFIARRGFFYTHGQTSQQFADAIKAAIPAAVIVEHGEVWKPFRGGASVAQSSHWFVRFTVADVYRDVKRTCGLVDG